MYIHTEKKLAFIAHPRTASNAIRDALVNRYGFESDMSHHSHWTTFPKDWTVFATVRDPFDLMVSWYFLEISKTKQWKPFSDWLPERMFHPNEYMRSGLFFGLEYCTDILHYENLQEEFDQLMRKVGLSPVHLRPVNVSEKRGDRDFISFYSSKLIDLVVDRFEGAIFDNGYEVPACLLK